MPEFTSPSEVCDYIAGLFPRGVSPLQRELGAWPQRLAPQVKTILRYLDRVDPRITAMLSQADRSQLQEARSALEVALERFLGPKDRHGPANVKTKWVARIYHILGRCPDSPTPESLTQLAFVSDDLLRGSIARDVDSLPILVGARQWKAVTVIAGSVLEALLLYQVEQHPGRAQYVVTKSKERWRGQPKDWGLELLIQAARGLDLLSETEAGQCKATQYYRNLIHPGVERTRQPCSEGTALAARAAVQILLEKWDTEP